MKGQVRNLQCPGCGKENNTHWAMICGDCDLNMVEANMLEKLPRDFSGGSEKKSPTLRFLGDGWTPKFGGKE